MKTTDFSLRVLREANLIRLPRFKNRLGGAAHSEPDGSDWSLNDWYTALVGEAGELGSVLKQVRRGDLTLEQAREDIAKECADVLTYLDILAYRCGVDLGAATMDKFNEVSLRVDAEVFICQNKFQGKCKVVDQAK